MCSICSRYLGVVLCVNALLLYRVALVDSWLRTDYL